MTNVLFINIAFYVYEYITEIKTAIEKELHADIDCLTVGRQGGFWESFAGWASRGILDRKIAINRQKDFFETHKYKKYNYIFVLVGRGLEKDLFEGFLQTQPQAIKILYLWDDVKRVENFNAIKDSFDYIWSSDFADYVQYGFHFLPLFYCDSYRYHGEEKIFDISVTGSLHSDRQVILEKILKEYLPQNQYVWYARMVPPRSQAVKLWIKGKGSFPFYMSYQQIPLQENADILKKSRVVLDMPFASQTGLSIRTFEALAAQTKIITTNTHIKAYDFYNASNIQIIDRNQPFIEPDFMKIPYQPPIESLVERYSISSWVNTLFQQSGA